MKEFMSLSAAGSGAGKTAIGRFCDAVIRWTSYALAFLTPLFFLPWTVDTLEFNKQLLVIGAAAIMGIAWLGKMFAEKKLEYRRSIVNVFVVLYVIAYGVSTWLSANQYVSVVGDGGQALAGFVTAFSLAVVYFAMSSTFREVRDLRFLLLSTVIGGFLTAAYALLQGVGFYLLPFSFAKTSSFNTIGTASALGVYLTYVITLCGGLILADKGSAMGSKISGASMTVFLWITALMSLFLVCAIDYWPVSACLLAASAILIVFAFVHAKSVKGVSGVLLPTMALIVSFLVLVLHFPVSLGFPAEVMPSVKASIDIASKTLRESPFFGSGPGTFIADYAKFRAPEVNQSQFWNVRFDRASSHVLTSLATTGLVGTLSWLLVSLLLLVSAGQRLFRTDEDTWHLLIGVFAAWFALFVARFLYSSTMTLETAFWMTMAMLVVSHRKDFLYVNFEESPRAAMSVSFLFILGVVVALSGIFVEGTRYTAEAAYASALAADAKGGQTDAVVASLETAVTMNGRSDTYRRNLAMAYLQKANEVLAVQTKLDQKSGEVQADYDKRVQDAKKAQLDKATQYTASAVNTAKSATDISATNVENWSTLASVYQGLMGVTDGADDWAIKAYEQAETLEPANPTFPSEIAKIYLYQSNVASQKSAADKDDATKQADKKTADDLLNKVIDTANKAVALKSDYAQAHYSIALAYAAQGKTKDAIVKMESVVRFNPQDVGVQFQLALLYYQDGRKDDAIGLLEAVVNQQPNFSNARWYLASMYEEKGDLDKAIAQIEAVAKLNPDSDIVKQKLADLTTKKAAGPTGLPQPVDQSVSGQQPAVKVPAPVTKR